MPSQLPNIINDIRQMWGRMPRSRQLAVAITAGLGVAGLVLYFSWSSNVRMVTAYSNLDAKDSAAVVDSLTSQGIPYELAGDGTTVRVPAEQVDEARLSLAQQGLPAGGSVGYEIFDQTNFGATDFVQRVNYQRSLEGELSRSIDSLDAVESSRVHLVLPKDALFSEQQDPATASVVLNLRGGGQITQQQIRGVTHLVSHAVEGLEEANITIVDGAGNTLMDGSTLAGGVGASGTNMELQRTYETTIENDVQGMLDNVLGAGKSNVSVRAELDFNTQDEQSEVYTPTDDGIIRSQESSSETMVSSGSDSQASPGTDSNVPPTSTATTGSGSTSNYEKNQDSTNYEINKTVAHVIKAPGTLKRLSVSLMLDDKVPEEQVASLQSAVAAAVGLNNDRGDQLAVSRIPFDTTAQESADAAVVVTSGPLDMVKPYLNYAIPIIALIGFFIFYRLMLRSLGKRREKWGVVPSFSIQELPVSGALEERTAEARRREVSVERVASIAKQQPTAVAEIVQSWLREGS